MFGFRLHLWHNAWPFEHYKKTCKYQNNGKVQNLTKYYFLSNWVVPAKYELEVASQWDKQGTQAPWIGNSWITIVQSSKKKGITFRDFISLADDKLLLLLHLLPGLLQLQLDGSKQLLLGLDHHLVHLLLLLLHLSGQNKECLRHGRLTWRCMKSSLSLASCCQRTRPAPRPRFLSSWKWKCLSLFFILNPELFNKEPNALIKESFSKWKRRN